jgi:hypothetical protein
MVWRAWENSLGKRVLVQVEGPVDSPMVGLGFFWVREYQTGRRISVCVHDLLLLKDAEERLVGVIERDG